MTNPAVAIPDEIDQEDELACSACGHESFLDWQELDLRMLFLLSVTSYFGFRFGRWWARWSKQKKAKDK